jgi:hypothetical protein
METATSNRPKRAAKRNVVLDDYVTTEIFDELSQNPLLLLEEE